jgi:hypothetical protein
MFDANDLTEVLALLEGVEERSGYYAALCPAHDDTNPSLSVTKNGRRVLIKCHAECDYSEIVAALEARSNGGRQKRAAADFTNSYEYRGDDGRVYVKHRRGRGARKRIWWDPSPPQGVLLGLFHEDRIPLAIAADETIYVVEGEEDVLAIERAGGVATTSGGTSSWRPHHAAALRGADVVIVRDKDTAGRTFAAAVKRSLREINR